MREGVSGRKERETEGREMEGRSDGGKEGCWMVTGTEDRGQRGVNDGSGINERLSM